MQWSRFFSGESAIRLRVANVSNTLSSIITVGSWLGPDDFEHVASLGISIYKQLTSLKSVCYRGQKVGVNVRGLAEGSQRRISSGASTARSSYPIEEAPEHLTQLGDMLIFCDKPVWNTEKTQNIESDYKKWLKNKKDNVENRLEYARKHYGRVHENIIGLGMADNYPGTTHRCCRAVESIALRTASISESVDGSSKNFFENLNDTKMARKASHENRAIKFDECGAIQFCLQGTDLMKKLNFNEKLTESLRLLLTSIGEYLQTL